MCARFTQIATTEFRAQMEPNFMLMYLDHLNILFVCFGFFLVGRQRYFGEYLEVLYLSIQLSIKA